MSVYSKVVWSEGLFLRPQHLQQQDRRERQDLHDLVRPVLGSNDEHVERVGDAVLDVACGIQRDVDSPGERDEPLRRPGRRERIELGLAQRGEDLAMRRKRSASSMK